MLDNSGPHQHLDNNGTFHWDMLARRQLPSTVVLAVHFNPASAAAAAAPQIIWRCSQQSCKKASVHISSTFPPSIPPRSSTSNSGSITLLGFLHSVTHTDEYTHKTHTHMSSSKRGKIIDWIFCILLTLFVSLGSEHRTVYCVQVKK